MCGKGVEERRRVQESHHDTACVRRKLPAVIVSLQPIDSAIGSCAREAQLLRGWNARYQF